MMCFSGCLLRLLLLTGCFSCPYSDNDAGKVLSIKPKPATGEQGTTFIFVCRQSQRLILLPALTRALQKVLWELTYWVGVGELNVAVSGPGGAGTFSQIFCMFSLEARVKYFG
jgi:hypothetical protein